MSDRYSLSANSLPRMNDERKIPNSSFIPFPKSIAHPKNSKTPPDSPSLELTIRRICSPTE